LIEDGGLQMNALLSLHISREWAEEREDLETVRAASCAVSYTASDAASYVSYAAAHAVQKDAALAYMADLVRARISADMICEVQNER